jgi:hypothetical protein
MMRIFSSTLSRMLVLLLAAALAVGSPVAMASSDGDEDERKLNISVDKDRVEIEFERETDQTEDSLKIRFDAGNAEFEVEYEAERGNVETEQELRLRLFQVFEFEDANSNGRFDAGEAVASAWDLTSGPSQRADSTKGTLAQWHDLSHSTVQSDQGVPGHKIQARAQLGSGVLGLDMYVFGVDTTINGTSISPTQVKFDILIKDYPYARNGTILGLLLETKTETETEIEHDDHEEGLQARSTIDGRQVLFGFSWVDEAMVDGTMKPVGSTIRQSKSETKTEGSESEMEERRVIILSYPRGSDIVHDPSIGISFASKAGAIPGPGVILTSVALLGVAVATMARRRFKA